MLMQKRGFFMHTSEKGLALIQRFEGCRLTAYLDRVGVWTIGWGTTNADKSITGRTIKRGLTITRRTADDWLRRSLAKKYEPLVAKYDDIYHWTQNEFDALVSFCYNVGSIDQLTDKGRRSKEKVCAAILLYNKAGGRRVQGLAERRQAEQKLFKSLAEGIPTSAEAERQEKEKAGKKAAKGNAGDKSAPKTPFKVKVTIPDLNIRSGPSTNCSVTGLHTGAGVFTIVEVRPGTGSRSGWGRLLSGAGWISLDYCAKI